MDHTKNTDGDKANITSIHYTLLLPMTNLRINQDKSKLVLTPLTYYLFTLDTMTANGQGWPTWAAENIGRPLEEEVLFSLLFCLTNLLLEEVPSLLFRLTHLLFADVYKAE